MERRGIPHLAKNERDVGHPEVVVKLGLGGIQLIHGTTGDCG
jgi:hypothetical protein